MYPIYMYIYTYRLSYSPYYKQLWFGSMTPFPLDSENNAFREHLNYLVTKEFILILMSI